MFFKFRYIIFLLVITSCNALKEIPENQYVLNDVKIKLNSEDDLLNKQFLKTDLQSTLLQKPNSKTLGVLHLKRSVYLLANRKKETKLRWWIKNKLGEPPVMYDSLRCKGNIDVLTSYYQNKGYFNVDVKEQRALKNKKAQLTYLITPNDPYIIKQITQRDSSEVEHISAQNIPQSLLKKGENFDVSILKEERIRIADLLNNKGYFDFSKDQVFFEIDSTNKDIDLRILLQPINDSIPFKIYNIGNIYVQTDYQALDRFKTLQLDTVSPANSYYFFNHKRNFNPSFLMDYIYFKPNKIYTKDDLKTTTKKFSESGNFKFINIYFTPKDSSNTLDCNIQLTPLKKQYFSYSLEGFNNFEGRFGSGITFAYTNRNITKRADKLNISLSSSIQFDLGVKSKDTSIIQQANITARADYYLNKLILPFRIKQLSGTTYAKTKISALYSYDRRIGYYSMHNTGFSFGYEWLKNGNFTQSYNPISASLILLPEQSITEAFKDRLALNPALNLSFQEFLILGSNYSVAYNNRKDVNDKSFYSAYGQIETAGNLAYAISNLNGKKTSYKILDRIYSQFIKLSAEHRYSIKINDDGSFHTRIRGGIAIPYGNSNIIPYVKQFYVGGANSIRAYRARALGPGGYVDTSNASYLFESGDILLESSAEYRFNIIKWFKGAFFVDAGNVWNRTADEYKPNSEFKLNTFYKQIAVGAGLGLRLDFDFFVIRTDLAFPVKSPSITGADSWVIKDAEFGNPSWRKNNLQFNVAIGYPF